MAKKNKAIDNHKSIEKFFTQDIKKPLLLRQEVHMKPDDVSQGCWDDFLAHRKAKKAIVTPRVIDRIRAEAQLANYTLEEALNECVDRGWQGFRAEWVMPKPAKTNKKEGLIFGRVIDMGDANVRRLSNGK